MEINKDLIIEGHNTSLENLTGKLITTSGTDLNDYRSAGVFIFTSSKTPLNIPDGEINGFVSVITEGDFTSSQWIKQIWLGVSTGKIYVRTRTSSGWSSWERYLSYYDTHYTKGETRIFNYANYVGFVSSNSTQIVITVHTSKSMEGLNVALGNLDVVVRGVNGYLISRTQDKTNWSIEKRDDYTLVITRTDSNNPLNVTNNTPVVATFYAGATVIFS